MGAYFEGKKLLVAIIEPVFVLRFNKNDLLRCRDTTAILQKSLQKLISIISVCNNI